MRHWITQYYVDQEQCHHGVSSHFSFILLQDIQIMGVQPLNLHSHNTVWQLLNLSNHSSFWFVVGSILDGVGTML